MEQKIKYFAPISIGNFSVGFDLLGLAVAPISGELLGDVVSIERAEEFQLTCSGPYASDLPPYTSENLVAKAFELFSKEIRLIKQEIFPVEMHLQKNLPIGSGLGSSASSIVAALYGLNHFFEEPFNVDKMLEMAGQLEGEVSGSVHFDNVAPCLLGGLQLMSPNQAQPSVAIPFPEHWNLVVSYPGTQISTEQARKILPQAVSMEKSIQFAQNLAVFIHAMHLDDEHLAASVLFDVIAEEHRQNLIPGFMEFRDFAKSMGALAFGISGSGPTVFSICNDVEVANKVQKYALKTFCKNHNSFSHICSIDSFGVRPISENGDFLL